MEGDETKVSRGNLVTVDRGSAAEDLVGWVQRAAPGTEFLVWSRSWKAAMELRRDVWHRLVAAGHTLPPLRDKGTEILRCPNDVICRFRVEGTDTPSPALDSMRQWIGRAIRPPEIQQVLRMIEFHNQAARELGCSELTVEDLRRMYEGGHRDASL